MKIRLTQAMCENREMLFAQSESLKAYTYCYESGIAAVRLENSKGYIIVLPFNGQMVWDAVFYGRSLKMETSYEMPRPATLFRDTYGCYIMHCGALTMGCPSKDDDHAHHGELPYATYDKAYIVTGEDAKGKYIAVTGEYEYHRAFDNHYIARPLAKLYEESSLIDVSMSVENKSMHDMEYMYMSHVNNTVSPGGKIYQTLQWMPENMVVRVSIPQYNEPDPVFLKLLDDVQKDVSVTRVLEKDDIYDPEIVLFLRGVKADEKGYAHFLYEHKDGTSDYTTYDAKILNRGVRWIVNHSDWRSMGMVLPSTAEPEGYIAEKAKGNVRMLKAGQTFFAEVTAGFLDTEKTKEVKANIERIMGGEAR